MRVVSIVGARPQFIKAAPLSRALRRNHHEFLIHTGQHYDPNMSEVFFEELDIPKPDLNLGIGGLSNLEQVSQMMLALRPTVEAQRPDWMVVYGDTNSTLAGALTGCFLNVPVAHIEAGLRSYNRAMPEENNRVLTDHISNALFCPTGIAADNLAREGITANVHVVGDVMIDALLQNQKRTRADVLTANRVTKGQYFLATIHRASNTDTREPLAGILAAFARFPDMPIILPAHPRFQKALERFGLVPNPNVRVISPVGYLEMISLMASSSLVLTDSGGIQKEAYALKVPCVTLREETEWVETVESGWNQLAGTDEARIKRCVEQALSGTPAAHPDYYGDGQASERIVEILALLQLTRKNGGV